MYQKRFYRGWINRDGLHITRLAVKETDLQILTDKPLDKAFARARIQDYRRKIEAYISRDPRFLTSLKPLEVELTAPGVVQEMAKAARKVNVGPMAAVSGAIAQSLGRDLLRKGYKDVVIENGGDIFIKSRKTSNIGIYAGKRALWNKIAIRIRPGDMPLGVCTSSGMIGHSLSFGRSDGVIILSKNVALADAAATATANLVNCRKDLEKAVGYARSIRGILGVAVIFRETLATWGKVEFLT